jgi:4-hydroxy-2-oxoglutarate aldolase
VRNDLSSKSAPSDSLAGIDLDSDILAALADHPNIVGTKLSCGNIGKLHRLTTSFPATSFAVFPGQSAVVMQGLLSGSAGAIAALPNILPKVHLKLYALWKEGKIEEAMALQGKLGHADWTVSKIGGIGGIKAIVSKHFGYGVPWVRGPLSSGNVQALDTQDLGVLVELIEMEKAL